ncbi:MAG: glutamine--fructose-6-phosphate transaminase (isomerizing), partial [Tumebacillaceae bacterium]
MSGIVGYVGKRNAQSILLDCLERLDYRGYDSAGLSISNLQRIESRRAVGRIKDLRGYLHREPISAGTLGIGHTRWATHGIPSVTNAHPLSGCDERFFVVHNGIIDNYPQLKRSLMQKGHHFVTDTDTEVIPHLLEEYDTGDLETTVRIVLPMLEGSFALAIMSQSQPDRILAVSQDNPLVLGFGKGEAYLASDIPALLTYTREMHPIKNGEIVVLTTDKVRVTNLDGEELEPKHYQVQWDLHDEMLQEYEHYMLKEIFEQPKAIQDTLHGRLTANGVHLPELEPLWEALGEKRWRQIDIVASGTSYHCGLIGKKLIERLVDVPVEVCFSSEFVYDHPALQADHLVIVISQSGETADTLSALREAKQSGCQVIAITNTPGSTITRKADCTLAAKAGPELAVPTTKAYTAHLAVLILLAIWLAEKCGGAGREHIPALLESLDRVAVDVESALIMTQDAIDQFAQITFDQEHILLMGRGLDY